MAATASAPADLEPIETASVGELRVLQLRRLQWTLRHAYDNVPLYSRAGAMKTMSHLPLKDVTPHLERWPASAPCLPRGPRRWPLR
jgi:phenylacetate-coenzyme A ligase PaaK-like adenylate-forming protein